MDPITLYLLIFLGAVGILMLAASLAGTPVRSCPGCGRDIAIQARKCRSCGYRPR
jgi:hypothetical protein